MHTSFKIITIALSCLLIFNPQVHAGERAGRPDAVLKSHVPAKALSDALLFRERFSMTSHLFRFYALAPLDRNRATFGFIDRIDEGVFPTISESNFIVIFDLDLPSSSKRLFIIDLRTGSVESMEAAHGVESECRGKRTGYACTFISDRESKASPLGFFATGETYSAHSGPGIRLNGLESKSYGFSGNDVPSTIIIHGASYVQKGHAGLSWGCPALNPSVLEGIKSKLAPGTLFYFYSSSLNFEGRSPMVETIRQ